MIKFKNLLLVVFTTFIVSASYSQTKSILFLGNSYVYTNDLPQVLKSLSLSLGDTIEVASNSPGGSWLSQHCVSAASLNLIASRAWDYVVVQEQSQKPAFPPAQVEAETYPYAKILCDSIYSNNLCTNVLFFMTWGYKNGDSRNCASYPPICTYEGMQQRLRESYLEMAEDNEAMSVPVGMSFKRMRELYPDVELYSSDESHPSMAGTYLAACTFYASMYRQSPIGASYVATLDDSLAITLQNIAASVVLDSLDTWFMNDFELNAEVVSEQNSKFLEIEVPYTIDSCVVDYGDGRTDVFSADAFSTESAGLHKIFKRIELNNYAESDTYEITISIYNKGICEYDSDVISVEIQILSSIEDVVLPYFENPVTNGSIRFSTDIMGSYEIYSIDGKLLNSGEIVSNTIDVSFLNSGVYILKYCDQNEKFVVK